MAVERQRTCADPVPRAHVVSCVRAPERTYCENSIRHLTIDAPLDASCVNYGRQLSFISNKVEMFEWSLRVGDAARVEACKTYLNQSVDTSWLEGWCKFKLTLFLVVISHLGSFDPNYIFEFENVRNTNYPLVYCLGKVKVLMKTAWEMYHS